MSAVQLSRSCHAFCLHLSEHTLTLCRSPQLGEHEFVPTRDCEFAFPDERRSVGVIPISPALGAHVAGGERVVVRKFPHEKAKGVGYLLPGDRVKIVGATRDYTFVQVGHKQFVATASLKAGNPLVELRPPVQMHMARHTAVYDQPVSAKYSLGGDVVSSLEKGDVVSAVAATEDYEWVKIGPHAYVRTESTRMGLPHPGATVFPKPLLVKLGEGCGVVKNPVTPDVVVRTLAKGDELEVFGVTNDFKWLVVARHRYIPLLAARLVSPLPKEVPLRPGVPVKLSADEVLRHVPAANGRMMARGKRGEEFTASAVTEDFEWLKVGERQWVPLRSVKPHHAPAAVRVLATPVQVTLREDAAVRRRPDKTSKKRRTIAAGTVVTARAATPDAEWLQVSEKEFIEASKGVLAPVAAVSPLTPGVSVVLVRDGKVYQSPDRNAVVVQRLARGEVVSAVGTTTDLKWLKLGANRFLPTQDASHVPALVELRPAVSFVVATAVKARNVPAFGGMGVMVVGKGTGVVGTATTADHKWVRVGEGRYLPTAALVLAEGEGDEDVRRVLERRTGESARKAERGGRVTGKTLAPRLARVERAATTPDGAASLLRAQQSVWAQRRSEFERATPAPTRVPAAGGLQRTANRGGAPVRQVRVVADAPVMNAARDDATQVKTLRRGTLATVYAVDSNLRWVQVGADQFIRLDATDVAEQVRRHKL